MLTQITAHHIMSEVTTGLTTVLKHHTGLFLTLLFDQEGCQIIEGGFHMGTREDWLRQEEIAIVLKGVTELTAIGIQTEETVQILQIHPTHVCRLLSYRIINIPHTYNSHLAASHRLTYILRQSWQHALQGKKERIFVGTA